MKSVSVLALNGLDDGRRLEVRQGLTVAQIIDMALPGATDGDKENIRVSIKPMGDAQWHAVPEAAWGRVRPSLGCEIAIRVVPSGENLGSILAVVVTVAAVAAGQFYVAPLAASYFASAAAASFATQAFTAAAVVAGNLAVRALVPPRTDASKQQDQRSPTALSIAGWKNAANPGGPIPCHFGEMRFAPPYAAPPYTEVRNKKLWNRVRFLIGYPELDLSDHRIGETPIDRFDDLDLEVSDVGGDDPDLNKIYEGQTLEEQVGATLAYPEGDSAVEIIRRSATHAKRLGVILGFPSGLVRYDRHGDKKTAEVEIRIEYRKVGDSNYTTYKNLTIKENELKPLWVYEAWEPPTRGQYDVRLTRQNQEGDQGDGGAVEQCDWVALQSYRPENPTNFGFPVVEVAIRVRASEQLNGTLDSYNCLVKRKALAWNGSSWNTQVTRNPASAFRWMLQQRGAVEPLENSEIDEVDLQEWFEHCADEDLTYDRVHDTVSSLHDALLDVCAAGRATPHDRGDKWTVCVDRPKTQIAATVGTRNSWGLKVKRAYTKHPDALRGKFVDRTNGYSNAEWVIPWLGHTGDIITIEEVDLPGITDPTAAFRALIRRMYEVELRPDIYQVYQDIESLDLIRGDLARLSHDVLDRKQISARVGSVEAESNTVTIDELVTHEEGQTYAVRFRSLRAPENPDTSWLTTLRTLVTVPGEGQVLTLSGSGTLPAEGDLAFVGLSGEESREVILHSVERAENLTALLTFVDHAPTIDALLNATEVPEWTGIVGDIPEIEPVAPAVPVIDDIFSGDAGDGDVHIKISAGSGLVPVNSFDVDHRLQGGSWTTISHPAGGGDVVISGVYTAGQVIEVRARAVALSGGLTSGYTGIVEHTVLPGPVPPQIISYDAIRLQVDHWRHEFEYEGAGVAGVRIRYREGIRASWSDLDPLHTGILTVSPWDVTLPDIDGYYTFGISAVSSSGAELGTPMLIVRYDSVYVPALQYNNAANSAKWLFLSAF